MTKTVHYGSEPLKEYIVSMEKKSKKYNLPYLLRKNSHYINDIFGDNEERIWAITSQGISYYEYEKDSLQIFLRH